MVFRKQQAKINKEYDCSLNTFEICDSFSIKKLKRSDDLTKWPETHALLSSETHTLLRDLGNIW